MSEKLSTIKIEKKIKMSKPMWLLLSPVAERDNINDSI